MTPIVRIVAFASLFAPVAAAAPIVRADPERVILGEDRAVVVRVERSTGGELNTAASAGTLTRADSSRAGVEAFRWTPPDIRYPTTAVLVFWEPTPQAPNVTVLAIPLVGRTTLEMDTEPDAQVRVVVGDESFGPVQADPRGRVAVPIHVPPGVRTAAVVATARGRETSRRVDLRVPEGNPWVAALGPTPVPLEGGWAVLAGAGSVDLASATVHARGARLAETASSNQQRTFRVTPTDGAGGGVLVVSSFAGEERRLEAKVSAEAWKPAPMATPSLRIQHLVSALGGGFDAGSGNLGPAFEASLVVGRLDFVPGARGRMSGEVNIGFRLSRLAPSRQEWGALSAFPVTAGLRLAILREERFGIAARAGAGVVPFLHSAAVGSSAAFRESGIGFEGYAALQGAYAMGPVSVLAEFRGTWTTARTPRLEAHPGGAMALVGVGWAP